jgi:hypothetical protein
VSSAVSLLRAQAQRIDDEYAAKQLRAERELSGIRHRIAFEKAERMLDLPETSSAPGLCLECLDGTHDRRRP